MLFVEIERHTLEHLFNLRTPRRHDGNPFTTLQIKSGREVTIVHQVPSRDAVHHHARDALEHLTALDVDCLTALTVLNMHLLTIDNESILIGRNIFPPQLLLIGEIQIARRPHFIVQERDGLHLGETACDASAPAAGLGHSATAAPQVRGTTTATEQQILFFSLFQ